jgi:hypothetical protein
MYASIFGLFAFIKGQLDRSPAYILPTLGYLFPLLASMQRQELAGALIVGLAAYVVIGRGRSLPGVVTVSIIAAPLMLFGFFMLNEQSLLQEAERWGLSGHAAITLPRPVLYQHALRVAGDYFPMGSGLGTYAGAGAQKFDLSLYFDLGFARYSWFLTKYVLMDTYWPNYIAETGWFGAALHLLMYLMLLGYAAIQALQPLSAQQRLYWVMAMAGVMYLSLLSFSSPAFQDPGLAFLPLVLWGVAFQKSAGAQPRRQIA